MALRLVFLGRLEDAAGMAEMTLDWPAPAPPDAVLALLPAALAERLGGPRVKWALNGVVLAAGAQAMLADGDELAFLPPVSGG